MKALFIFATITPSIVTISHNKHVNERSSNMRLSDALIACLLALPGLITCFVLIVLLSLIL